MTPREYLSDLPERATELQISELWSQRYAGRRIKWSGEIWSVHLDSAAFVEREEDRRIEVSVMVVRPRDSLLIHALFPAAQKAALLRYSKGDQVNIEGLLPSQFPILIANIVLTDASVSLAK
jgi:hypothetical protein